MQDRINLAELSNTFQAFIGCVEKAKEKGSNQKHYAKMADVHEERIGAILTALPSGSGLDAGVKFDWDKSAPERFVFTFGWHFMNDGGYYDGWGDFRMVIKPSFMGGFGLKIYGKDRRDIKDYLYDLFNWVFYVDQDYQIKARREAEQQNS